MNEREDDTPKPSTDIEAIIYASGLARPDAERVLVALESVGWEVKPRTETRGRSARDFDDDLPW